MQKEKILIKTYPTLSSTYGELACTAGIKEGGTWIRLYPIPFRRLKEDYRFEKYRWIEIPIERNLSDFRPESYKPGDLTQIKRLDFIDTSQNWLKRKQFILEKLPCYTDMSELITRAKASELSLALFKPSRVKDFIWENTEREWDKNKLNSVLADLKQGMLFSQDEFVEDFQVVDKLPYKFSYVFEDLNGKQCTMMVEDWEVGALYRSCMRSAGSETGALEKVKEKYLRHFASKTDLYFYLGTTKQWHLVAPNPFVIVGLFTPPKDNQTYLEFSG